MIMADPPSTLHFFFDEAGDPTIGRTCVLPLASGGARACKLGRALQGD